MGGATTHPTYEEICTGKTGHAEVVQLTFNADIISIREILEIFFTLHNPTHLNHQGNDMGTQYRSAIFFHDTEQKILSEQLIAEINLDAIWPVPVVTEVTEHSTFYHGEQYHQNYANQNPENAYCQAVVSPKLAKFRATFVNKLK